MAIGGRFNPKNPAKYAGNPGRIIFRSSWECSFMKWLDSNDAIIRWGSEEIAIPYISPLDNRVHRYFPDMIIMYKHKDGSIRKEIIEIKPYKETVPTPKMTPRDAQALLVNTAKWKAAATFAEMHGAIFRVLTERSLFLNGGINKRTPPKAGRTV